MAVPAAFMAAPAAFTAVTAAGMAAMVAGTAAGEAGTAAMAGTATVGATPIGAGDILTGVSASMDIPMPAIMGAAVTTITTTAIARITEQESDADWPGPVFGSGRFLALKRRRRHWW
jgi:hypothetical protein